MAWVALGPSGPHLRQDADGRQHLSRYPLFPGSVPGAEPGDTLWVWTLTFRHFPVGAHPGPCCPLASWPAGPRAARGTRAQVGEGMHVHAGCAPCAATRSRARGPHPAAALSGKPCLCRVVQAEVPSSHCHRITWHIVSRATSLRVSGTSFAWRGMDATGRGGVGAESGLTRMGLLAAVRPPSVSVRARGVRAQRLFCVCTRVCMHFCAHVGVCRFGISVCAHGCVHTCVSLCASPARAYVHVCVSACVWVCYAPPPRSAHPHTSRGSPKHRRLAQRMTRTRTGPGAHPVLTAGVTASS